MTMRRNRRPARKRYAGLTLLEVLVALSIGAFMLVGLMSLVASVSRSRTDLDVTSEQIENGRFALQLFIDEISLAGFYGARRKLATFPTLPDPCSSAGPVTNLGFDNNPTLPSPIPAPWDGDVEGWEIESPVAVRGYPAGTTPGCLSNMIPGSEVLVVHRVHTSQIDPDFAAIGQPYLQVSACDSDPASFVIAKPSASPPPSSDYPLHEKDCSTPARLWPYTIRVFYLASCDDCSSGGDGIPTLKMRDLVGATLQTTPLVEGVSDMHFEYGLDFSPSSAAGPFNSGDGAPDCYTDDPSSNTPASGCPTGTYGWNSDDNWNWSRVVSIRVHLLVRTVDTISGWIDDHTYDLGRGSGNESGPFNDGFRRQVYTTTSLLPNVAGPRE